MAESRKRFLLIKYKSSAKKIAVTSDHITMRLIQDNIQNKFNVQNADLQYWDNDVDDWLDLDDESIQDIQDKTIVKVQVVCRQPDIPSGNTQVDNLVPEPPRVDEQPQAEEKTSKTPEQGKNEAGSSTGKHELLSNVLKRKPWPRKYDFPSSTCPKSLLLKLESHQDLVKRDISQLLDTLYNDVTLYEGGLYPTSEKYGTLVDVILSTFPYLAKQGEDMSLQSVRVYWKEKLKYKWGNERKVRDRELPEVKSRKRKSVDKPEIPAKRINLTWGLANYLPPQLPSEDATSLNHHVEWLQREWRKTEPHMSSVELKMNLTFPQRRTDVMESLSVAELLEKYPWLKRRDQLLLEFSRLGPNTTTKDMDTLLMDGISKYHEAISYLAKGKKMPQFQTKIYEELHLQRVDSQRKYSSMCAAVLGLGTLLKEKLEKLMKIGDDPEEAQTAMQLVVKDKVTSTDNNVFEVHIEGKFIFKCDTFMEAMAGLLASIYAFNLAYPKEFEKTFIFLQNVVLGLNDESQTDKRIIAVLSDINKERKQKQKQVS